MTSRCYLVDENTAPALADQLRRHQPKMTVLKIGDEMAPRPYPIVIRNRLYFKLMNALRQTRPFMLSFLVCFLFIVGRTEAASEGTRFAEIRAEYDKLLEPLLSEKIWKDSSVSDRDIFEAWNRLWSVIGDWTVAYLEETPNVAVADVAKKIEELYPLHATAVQLAVGDQTTYVVSVYAHKSSDNLALNGTFFIVTRTGARSFRVAWNIKDIAAKHYASRDEIGYWAYVNFAYSDGPLIVSSVSRLPSSKTDTPRFYIDATAMAAAGGFPKQISIWEWNGSEAMPLLIKTYRSTGYTGEVEFDGEYLKIPMKEDYKIVDSCGTCPGATVVWTLKVTSSGIDDLGRAYVEPEMKLLDDLWDRVRHEKNTDDLASHQVVETLREIKENMHEDGSLGQGGGDVVLTANDFRILRFGADELGCAHVFFEIVTRNSNLYFSKVRVVEDCEHNSDEVWKRIKETWDTRP